MPDMTWEPGVDACVICGRFTMNTCETCRRFVCGPSIGNECEECHQAISEDCKVTIINRE